MAARQTINFTILALVALGFSVLPGGDATLNVILTLLGIVFFAAIALLGYRLYREHRFTLDSLAEVERLVLYGSVALAFLTFVASKRLFKMSGGGGGGIFLAAPRRGPHGGVLGFPRPRPVR